jgi:hypothetical protein
MVGCGALGYIGMRWRACGVLCSVAWNSGTWWRDVVRPGVVRRCGSARRGVAWYGVAGVVWHSVEWMELGGTCGRSSTTHFPSERLRSGWFSRAASIMQSSLERIVSGTLRVCTVSANLLSSISAPVNETS